MERILITSYRYQSLFVKFSILIAFILLSILFVDTGTVQSQDKWWKEKKFRSEAAKAKHDLCKKTFLDIANGFVYRNAGSIISSNSQLIYLDVFGNEKGFYSLSQAEIILSNFMDNFPLESFDYKSSSKYNNYASATGHYTYRKGSSRSKFTATISLKYSNKVWYVDQLIIN